MGELAKKSARCPFHDDQRNSFSMFKGESGAWFWTCHAGCGQGDEITFLEKHKGISTGEAIKIFCEMAGCAPVTSYQQSAINNQATSGFDWQACVDALTTSDLERLGNERWYSRAFCDWLHENKLIGAHNGRVAFPNGNGTVVGAHIWQGDKDWLLYPAGNKTQPYAIGALKNAKQVHLFESQRDMLAFADRSGNYEAQGVAFVTTRGAANAALVKDKLPEGASGLALPQNDAAGEKWLTDLSSFAPKLGVARVPVSINKRNEFGQMVEVDIKDLNDWTKAGASAEDIYAAFFRNELYKPGRLRAPHWFQGSRSTLRLCSKGVCDYVSVMSYLREKHRLSWSRCGLRRMDD
jgi:CHC2-type zinc finger protein